MVTRRLPYSCGGSAAIRSAARPVPHPKSITSVMGLALARDRKSWTTDSPGEVSRYCGISQSLPYFRLSGLPAPTLILGRCPMYPIRAVPGPPCGGVVSAMRSLLGRHRPQEEGRDERDLVAGPGHLERAGLRAVRGEALRPPDLPVVGPRDVPPVDELLHRVRRLLEGLLGRLGDGRLRGVDGPVRRGEHARRVAREARLRVARRGVRLGRRAVVHVEAEGEVVGRQDVGDDLALGLGRRHDAHALSPSTGSSTLRSGRPSAPRSIRLTVLPAPDTFTVRLIGSPLPLLALSSRPAIRSSAPFSALIATAAIESPLPGGRPFCIPGLTLTVLRGPWTLPGIGALVSVLVGTGSVAVGSSPARSGGPTVCCT